jgi:hypothetical protein
MATIKIKPVAIGLIFALLSLFCGMLHGMAFGAKEESIKASLRDVAKSSPALSGSKKKVKKAVRSGWKYLKRAHEHFMGLGTAGLALIIFIAISPAKDIIKTAVSTIVGAGMFLYPLFWTLTGIKTAEVGAHAAKESLELLAQAGAGLSFIGLLGTIFIAVTWIKSERTD